MSVKIRKQGCNVNRLVRYCRQPHRGCIVAGANDTERYNIRLETLRQMYKNRHSDKPKEKTNPLLDRMYRPESIPTKEEMRDFFAEV